MSQQHTALLVHEPNAPFIVGKRTTPTPGPGQILVRNKAVALNPIDYFMQKGYLVDPSDFPLVVGIDGAGIVHAVGSEVTAWKVGDSVFYHSKVKTDYNTFQELTLVDAARIAKVPSNLSFEEVATVALGLATAAVGPYKSKSDVMHPSGKYNYGGAGLTPPWEADGRGKYVGQAILIMGGSSSVGQFAIQLAKLSGFSTIVTTASKRNEAYCKSAGATHVLDYNEVPYTELAAAVSAIVGDAPVPCVYDAVSSKDSQEAGWKLLSPHGTLVIVMEPSPAIPQPGAAVGEDGRRTVRVFGSVHESGHQEFGAGMYAALTELLEKGDLKPNKVEHIGHGLEVIPAGLERLKKGVSGIKLVASL